MTYVLESFAKELGRSIENDFALPRLTCWRILKGGTSAAGISDGVAVRMAQQVREYLLQVEVLGVIQALTGFSRNQSAVLLERLVHDGILAESLRWNGESYEEVLQFPYQRFGDHIIARHLLEAHLNTESETTVRRSFYKNRPLGRIFEIDDTFHSYVSPGLASAIMLEFPERVKRSSILGERRELLFLLPRRCWRLYPLRDAFLAGLQWRSVDNINTGTERIMKSLLSSADDGTMREALEVLTELSTRPDHFFSSQWLFEYLQKFSMAERDLIWSEFLRGMDEHSPIEKAIQWVERNKAHNLNEEGAKALGLLFAMILTTSSRLLRDRATRALVFIGERYPNVTFELNERVLGFNDPYVPERVLAACYGVAMRQWANPGAHKQRSILPDHAKWLVRSMFLPDAKHATTHALARDYALGIIELARQVAPYCIANQNVKFIRRPLKHIPSPFLKPRNISTTRVERNTRALGMDFENYTLGRLTHGRMNYDYRHTGFKQIRRQILWRIAKLGYDYESKFHQVDTEIGQADWYRTQRGLGKIDRYGKKYSWIAYFEMYGVLEDEGALPEWRQSERCVECDIDPSFPEHPRSWNFPRKRLFKRHKAPAYWLSRGPDPNYEHLYVVKSVDGIRGPWVLLDGHIEEAAAASGLNVLTLIRGIIVEEEDVETVVQAYEEVEHPGNDKIPSTGGGSLRICR